MPNYPHISNKKCSQISLLKKSYVRIPTELFVPNMMITTIHLHINKVQLHILFTKSLILPYQTHGWNVSIDCKEAGSNL